MKNEGIDIFSFELLEVCHISDLDEKESFILIYIIAHY